MRIILASKSPRRRELLSAMFSSFEIIVEETDEHLDDSIHPSLGVELLAIQKGRAVEKSEKIKKVGEIVRNTSDNDKKVGDILLKRFEKSTKSGELIISSDTLVELNGVALGKPASKKHAFDMLMALSGVPHHVHTGISVIFEGKTYSGVASSRVFFKKITENEAIEYINTGEPMDKAGAYAIQGIGGKFVERYDGDFDTIVGLSTALTEKLVREALGL